LQGGRRRQHRQARPPAANGVHNADTEVGLVLEVPAFPALRGAQGLVSVGAGRADRGQGVPARDEHGVLLAGVEVGAAQLDRADADAGLCLAGPPGARRANHREGGRSRSAHDVQPVLERSPSLR
jgi:hypothetical protein